MKNRNFRANDKTWKTFKTVCSQNNKTASEALREFIKRANRNGDLDYTFKQTTIFDYTNSGSNT